MVVVWFKRDLRLLDHEPLVRAIESKQKILLLFSFEPLWTNDAHYSEKHINFIKQSLIDLQRQLKPFGTKVLVVDHEILSVLDSLNVTEKIQMLFSHQETGMKMTYDRDKEVAKWCRRNKVIWKESIQNGVFRGIKNRKKWKNDWVAYINQPIAKTNIDAGSFYTELEIDLLIENHFKKVTLETEFNKRLQKGGTHTAVKYLDSFLNQRISGYNFNYSKPATSRLHSSRLSPYLAWGNLSTRQVCQYAANHKNKVDKRNLSSFLSRLRWQAHFIQKFEMEGEMEFLSVNKGYRSLVKEPRPHLQQAWREGKTGVPLLDACNALFSVYWICKF